MHSFNSGVPIEHTKSSVNLTWSNTSNLKFMQTKGDTSKPGKAGGADGNLYARHCNELLNTMRPVTAIPDGSSEPLPVRDRPTFKILGGGKKAVACYDLTFSLSIDCPVGFTSSLVLVMSICWCVFWNNSSHPRKL